MEIPVRVDGQRIRIPTNRKSYAKGSKKFVKFKFDLSSDWNGMTVTAQFVQNGKAHPRDLVGNCVYLPTELSVGKCILVLRGVASGDVIGTTNGLSLYIDDNMLVQNVDNTEIDETLYDNLVRKINGKLDKTAIGMADECDLQQVHRRPDGSLVTRVASVSGAKVGDLMQITAVDGKGVPTALKPVTMEELGGTMEHIITVTAKDASPVLIDRDKNGQPLRLRAALIRIQAPSGFKTFIVSVDLNKHGQLGSYHCISKQVETSLYLIRVGEAHGYYTFEASSMYYINETGPLEGDTYRGSLYKVEGDPINYITLTSFTADGQIEVYGVRA